LSQCPNCQAEVNPDQRFCHVCGGGLPQQAPPPPQPQYQYAQPQVQARPAKSSGSTVAVTCAIIAACGLALLVCGGAVAYIYAQNKARALWAASQEPGATASKTSVGSSGVDSRLNAAPNAAKSSAVQPGEEAAKAAALEGYPDWVARVAQHTPSWNTAIVEIGPPQSEYAFEVTVSWNDAGGRYEIEEATPIGGDQGYEDAGGWMFLDSDTRKLTDSELQPLSDRELCIARNEVYARRGLVFESQPLKDYFEAQPWYSGTTKQMKSVKLSAAEQANVDKIMALEKKRGSKYVKGTFKSW